MNYCNYIDYSILSSAIRLVLLLLLLVKLLGGKGRLVNDLMLLLI